MTPSWTATSSKATTAKTLDKDLTLYEGDRRSKNVKAQYEAAQKAATALMGTFEGKALVSLSGYAADKDLDLDRIQITVARAPE